MAPTFIALGPRKSHVVVYKDRWHAQAPEGSRILTTKQRVKNEHGTPHSFSFGEGGSWFLSYSEPNGTSRWKWEGIDKYYPNLHKWLEELKDRPWAAKGLTVSLGPKGSYWAWENKRGFSYCNLSEKLIDTLMEDKDRRHSPNVTLGLDGSFIYWTDRGNFIVSITGYEGAADWLNERLMEDNKLHIVTASLSAFSDDIYFFLLSDGTARWQVPEHLEPRVKAIRDSYMENRPKIVAGGT